MPAAAMRPVGVAAARAPRRVRGRLGAAAGPATPLRRLPPVRGPARDGRGDQLRLRVPRGGVARHDHRGLARDRRPRSRSTRLGLDTAETVRHVVATSWLALAVAGAAAGHVRARRRRPRRGRARRRLRRRHRAPISAASSSRSARGSSPRSGSRSPSRSPSSPAGRAACRGSRSARSPSRCRSPGSASSLLELDGLALAMGLTTTLILGVLLRELRCVRRDRPPPGPGGRPRRRADRCSPSFRRPSSSARSRLRSSACSPTRRCSLILRPKGLVAGWRYLRALT